MKYRIFFRQFFFIFIFVLPFRLFAQDRIFTDNPFYTSFDKIHFTVFPDVSPEVYYAAELVDAHGRIWKQLKLKTVHSRLSGTFSLDYRLKTGFYWIRVYPAAFYSKPDPVLYKPLVVVNAEDLDNDKWENTLIKITGSPSVYLLSENTHEGQGVSLIKTGIIDDAGKLISGSARITDNGNQDRYDLMNTNDGFFSGSFVPESGHTYSMTIKGLKNDSVTFSFNPAGIQKKNLTFFNPGTLNTTAGNIQILPDRNFYSPDDSIQLNLSGKGFGSPDQDGGLLVSVSESVQDEVEFDKRPVPLIADKKASTDIVEPGKDDNDECFCLRGHYINPSTGTPRANYSIALIGLGEKPGITFTHADKNGNFTFDASGWPENNSVYISTIGQPVEGLTYSDHFFRNFTEQPVIEFGSEDYAPLDSFITEAKIRSVLHFQYGNIATTASRNAEQILYDTTRVYSKPDVSYDLNDYLQFNDVADIIHNILIYVHLSSTKRGDRLFIFNNQNPGLNKNPLYLINGIPTRDLQLVLGLDVKAIQRIDLLYTLKAIRPFGIAGLGGIMAVYTTQNVEIPNTLKVDLKGLHKQEGIYIPFRETGIPDFSPVVFWDPDYRYRGGQPAPVIHLNNLLTDLKINVIGKNSEGMLVTGSAIIKIKPGQ